MTLTIISIGLVLTIIALFAAISVVRYTLRLIKWLFPVVIATLVLSAIAPISLPVIVVAFVLVIWLRR